MLESLDELQRRHDADPQGVAASLRQYQASDVAAEAQARYGWLLNHVLGEQLNQWPDALALHLSVVPQPSSSAVWRNRAVAAYLAGQPLVAWQAEAGLQQQSGADSLEVQSVVQLAVLQHATLDAESVDDYAASLHRLAAQTRAVTEQGHLLSLLASGFNNTVSALLAATHTRADDAIHRQALEDGAHAAKRYWLAVGTWVNHERADYLCAMVHNHLQQWAQALQAANDGIATINVHGEEPVDHAFLLLELAQAHRGLGELEAYLEARQSAEALAASFADDELKTWFAERVARLESMF